MSQIEYNGVRVDLNGKFSIKHTTTNFIFSGNIILLNEGGINNSVLNLEDKLRRKNKTFSLIFNGTNVLTYSHDDSSGFLMSPSLQKIPNDLSTTRTREYNFIVDIELPVNQDDYHFRRSASFNLSKDTNRRKIINFICEYTAGSGNSAIENYKEHFKKDFIDIIITLVKGTYEKVAENYTVEQENKILTAHLTYKEIIYNQGINGDGDGELDIDVLIDPQLAYSLRFDHTVGLSVTGTNAESMAGIYGNFNYVVTINKDLDGVNSDFNSIYEGLIRPDAIRKLQDVLKVNDTFSEAEGGMFILNESKMFYPHSYKVYITLDVFIPISDNKILLYDEELECIFNKNMDFTHLWDGIDNTYSLYGPGSETEYVRTITVTKIGSPFIVNDLLPAGVALPAGEELIKVAENKISSSGKVGGGYQPIIDNINPDGFIVFSNSYIQRYRVFNTQHGGNPNP